MHFYIDRQPLSVEAIQPDVVFGDLTKQENKDDRLGKIREGHISRCGQLNQSVNLSDTVFEMRDLNVESVELLSIAAEFAKLRDKESKAR